MRHWAHPCNWNFGHVAMDLHTAEEAGALFAVDDLLTGWEAALGAHSVALSDWADAERAGAEACSRVAGTVRLRPAPKRPARVLPVGADVYLRENGEGGICRDLSPATWQEDVAGAAGRAADDRRAFAAHVHTVLLPGVRTLRADISGRASTLRSSLSTAEGRLKKPFGVASGALANLSRVLALRSSGDEWRASTDVFVCEQSLVVATSLLLAERAKYAAVLGNAVRSAAALDRHAGATLAAAMDDVFGLLVRQHRAALVALGASATPRPASPPRGRLRASPDWSDDDVEARLLLLEAARPLGAAYFAALSAAYAGRPAAVQTRVVRAGFLMRPAGAFGRGWAVVWAVLTEGAFLHLFEAGSLSPARVPQPEMNLHVAALSDLNTAALSTLAGITCLPAAPAVSHVHAAFLSRPGMSVCVAASRTAPEASSRGLEHSFGVSVPAGRGVFARGARKHVLRAFVADDMAAWVDAIVSVSSSDPNAVGAVLSDGGREIVVLAADTNDNPRGKPESGDVGTELQSPFGDVHDIGLPVLPRSTPTLPDDELANPWGR